MTPGHASCHIPRQICALGPHPFNDTDLGESDHVVDKVLYQKTSKRTEETNNQLVALIRRGVKSKTLIAAYYRLKAALGFAVPAVAHYDLDTKYRMIGRQENTYVTYNDSIHKWVFEDTNTKICPLFDLKRSLTPLLISYARKVGENNEDLIEKLLISRHRGPYSMCLCSGLTFVCNEDECGMTDFQVYGTTTYGVGDRNTSRYDAVEVDFYPEINICQVLSIFAIIDNSTNKPIKFLLLVTPFKDIEEEDRELGDEYLPYSLLGYDFNPYYETVKYELIDASAVLRPCIAYADHDRCWDRRNKNKRYLSRLRYWGIRYATTDRGFGYGNNSDDVNRRRPPQPPPQAPTALSTRQLDDIYAQVRRRAGGNGYETDDGDFERGQSDDDDD
jgi:hypothetical protein